MRRFDVWQTDRERAEVHATTGLKILRGDHTRVSGRPGATATIWRPKATRPFVNALFKDEAEREAFIAVEIENALDGKRRVAKRRALRAGRLEGVELQAVNVGDIFDYSWGYDQTNVEFLQVVERHGRQVVVRELAHQTVPGSEGFMSSSVLPVKGSFLTGGQAKTLTKLIQWTDDGKAYLAMPYGWCDIWTGTAQYSSWYA